MSNRRIIVFDVETTGTDRRRDQVIELCVQFGLEADAPQKTWRVRPEVPISAGAQAVHGISTEDLADCPPFAEIADDFRVMVERADVLVGYNLAFDIEMVQAEFERLRQPRLDVRSKMIVDPFRLWQRCEPRTLQDAHRRFVGDSFDAAHSANADVAATGRVLHGMIERFGLPLGDWATIAQVCEPERPQWVGTSRHVQLRDGVAVLGFGKHAGTAVWQLAHGPDAGYLAWMANQDFPGHVVAICRAALELDEAGFTSSLAAEFGCGASEANATLTASPLAARAAS